jgi:hypothetical protein
MHAPAFIKDIWHQFDDFPMETLTKIWYFHKPIENMPNTFRLSDITLRSMLNTFRLSNITLRSS